MKSQMWKHTPVLPVLERLRQEDCEFEANLDCIGKLFLKNSTNQTKIYEKMPWSKI
jgi:hypothetical protein